MTLTVTPDRALVRTAGKSQRYVLVEIEAPVSSGTKPRLPLNFALCWRRPKTEPRMRVVPTEN